MSMQVDFKFPQQIEDVKKVKAALKNFDKQMRKMMLLMKDLGKTLGDVSESFAALTTLSFTDDKRIRKYVSNFGTQIVRMTEGPPYQNYNRLVHDEVLAPVSALEKAVKETEKNADERGKALEKYLKSKEKVEKTEKDYARKAKPLDTCKDYPKAKDTRDAYLGSYNDKDNVFQISFVQFIKRVETVTETTMRRYLELNASYMTSVIEALSNTDASVEEQVLQYRKALEERQAAEVTRRKTDVEKEVAVSGSPLAGAEAVSTSTSNSGSPHGSPAGVQQFVGQHSEYAERDTQATVPYSADNDEANPTAVSSDSEDRSGHEAAHSAADGTVNSQNGVAAEVPGADPSTADADPQDEPAAEREATTGNSSHAEPAEAAHESLDEPTDELTMTHDDAQPSVFDVEGEGQQAAEGGVGAAGPYDGYVSAVAKDTSHGGSPTHSLHQHSSSASGEPGASKEQKESFLSEADAAPAK